VPALFLAPIGGAAAGAFIYAGVAAVTRTPVEWISYMAAFVLVAHLPFTFLATWLVGLPWHSYLQRRRNVRSAAYWSAGAIVGAMVATAAFAAVWSSGMHFSMYPGEYAPGYGPPPTPEPGPLEIVAVVFIVGSYGALIGSTTGALAWLIRRPDRDVANLATSAP
jgi:hypothetical protein